MHQRVKTEQAGQRIAQQSTTRAYAINILNPTLFGCTHNIEKMRTKGVCLSAKIRSIPLKSWMPPWSVEYAKIPVLGDKKTLSREVIIGSDPDVVLGRAMTFTAANQTDPESYNGLGVDLYVQTATAAQGNPTLQGVIDDVKNIAAIFDAGETGTALVEELEDRLAAIEDRLDAEDSSEPQSVLIMTGLKDGTFGTFGGATGASLQFNMIEMMGGTMASTQSASRLTYENLIEFNPDVIFYVTAERNKDADATAVETLYNTEALQSVPAIAGKRVIEIPYAEFMDAGPRVFNAAETVLNALHPEN